MVHNRCHSSPIAASYWYISCYTDIAWNKLQRMSHGAVVILTQPATRAIVNQAAKLRLAEWTIFTALQNQFPCHLSWMVVGDCWSMLDDTEQDNVGMCREFEFSLISGPKLEDMAVTPRLQVSAGIATVQLAYGGKLILETTDLTAQALKVDTCCPLHTFCMNKRRCTQDAGL